MYKIFFFFLLLSSLQAQKLDKDFLLASPIYDSQFNSIDEQTESRISAGLQGKTLSDLLRDSIISREDMLGFAMPLGVFKNQKPIDFQTGMLDMWQSKASWLQKNAPRIDAEILVTALRAAEALQGPRDTMSLLRYRSQIIGPAHDSMLRLHQAMQPLYSAERKVFMDIISENLSPNILLGYNIQEMIPPTHLTKEGKVKDINPLFKAYFLDRLLREAGASFVAFFPARYDAMNSFGPFQFTSIAIKDIKQNSRLKNEFKTFSAMSDLRNLQDHALLAAFFSYNNWERLSFILQKEGTLTKFNTYFANYKQDKTKTKQLRIFISGITACMHHQPPQTQDWVKKYMSSSTSFEKIHYELPEQSTDKQLKKYYRSAAEAYLIMKVYDQLLAEE